MTAQRSLRNRPETLADSAGIGRLHHAAFVDPQVAPLVVAIRAFPG